MSSYSEIITVKQLLEEELDAVETLISDLDAKLKQHKWSDFEYQRITQEVLKLQNVIQYLKDRIEGRYNNEH